MESESKPSQNGGQPSGVAAFCPECGRKLLTQTSVFCNWCGAKINDPEYQERAAASRLERDQAERAAIEAAAAEEAKFGTRGRLMRRGKELKSRGVGNDPLA